jgi:hypothetical protein
VDGGGNIDTLTLDGSGLTLDLTNISNARIQDIEKKTTDFIPFFLHNNQINILLNPKRSISISIGTTMSINIIGNTAFSLGDIEKIDITGLGNNTLILNLNDVFDASTSTNILKVLGNSGDSVNALGFAKISNTETEGSITYDVYTHSSVILPRVTPLTSLLLFMPLALT